MQTLIVIDVNNDNVVVQDGSKSIVYTETYSNFLADGGISVPDGVFMLDWNKSIGSRWMNTLADPEGFPVEYLETVLSKVDGLMESKGARDKAAEDERSRLTFEGYDLQAEEDERNRVASLSPEEYEAELRDEMEGWTQSYLDRKAWEKRYKDIDGMASYISDPDPEHQNDAKQASRWRSVVWKAHYELVDGIVHGIVSGTAEKPSSEEFVANLPEFDWE